MFYQLWDLRIWDLNEIRWGFDYGDDRELGLVIPDATDYIIKHPNMICIPLFSANVLKNETDKQPSTIKMDRVNNQLASIYVKKLQLVQTMRQSILSTKYPMYTQMKFPHCLCELLWSIIGDN